MSKFLSNWCFNDIWTDFTNFFAIFDIKRFFDYFHTSFSGHDSEAPKTSATGFVNSDWKGTSLFSFHLLGNNTDDDVWKDLEFILRSKIEFIFLIFLFIYFWGVSRYVLQKFLASLRKKAKIEFFETFLFCLRKHWKYHNPVTRCRFSWRDKPVLPSIS